jgi:hypothetical protein
MRELVAELRIELLGGFRVTAGGRVLPESAWRRRKPAALVKLLALAPGHRLHREQAMDLLWPGRLVLTRDLRDAHVFVSFGAWKSIDAVRVWKGAPDFRERMARVLRHVAEFEPAELAVVAAAEAGAALIDPPRVV